MKEKIRMLFAAAAASCLFLLQQIIEDTVFFIQIRIYVHLTYIVKHIKIKILYAALF